MVFTMIVDDNFLIDDCKVLDHKVSWLWPSNLSLIISLSGGSFINLLARILL